ncbi:DUF1641 domain-containing protein [Paenibacillus senegalensis]|uniref:DUF1641 domain-containing protein n=1 Tax=Paenibacillus senegalensis TaxID=1465766 RepID=UPI000287D708|nr:DUF1641 domain-containing protein [Paenibacillus senegalensis]
MSQNTMQDAAQGVETTATYTEKDVLDQLTKPEVQQALTVLVENLPKLAEMTTILTKTYDIVQTVAKDEVLINDLKGGMEEFVKPVQEKAKGLAQAAIEANERSREESATVGLFGMLKMLKDPQVQQVLRFSQAFLEVLAERKNSGK